MKQLESNLPPQWLMEPPIPCLFNIALKLNVCVLEQSPEEHLLERRAGKAPRRAIYTPGKVKMQLEINLTESCTGQSCGFPSFLEGTVPQLLHNTRALQPQG